MSDSSRIVASELRKSVQDLRDKRVEWAAEDHRDSGVCYCPQPLPGRRYMGQESCRLCDGLNWTPTATVTSSEPIRTALTWTRSPLRAAVRSIGIHRSSDEGDSRRIKRQDQQGAPWVPTRGSAGGLDGGLGWSAARSQRASRPPGGS